MYIKRASLTDEFRLAVKLAGLPTYKISLAAGIRPPTFSGWLNGVNQAPIEDCRLIAVAKMIGFQPDRIFKFHDSKLASKSEEEQL